MILNVFYNTGASRKGNRSPARLNNLVDDKTVNLSKLKAFADDKNKRDSVTKTCCLKGRKLCGKRRKCC